MCPHGSNLIRASKTTSQTHLTIGGHCLIRISPRSLQLDFRGRHLLLQLTHTLL
jgi:hypothetical protein